MMTTREVGEALHRSPQTLRCWAMRGNGPIQPVRTRHGAPLLWRKSDVIAVLNGGTQETIDREILINEIEEIANDR